MKVIVYGSHVCPDTIYALNLLPAHGIETEYHDISGSMRELKAFLARRDASPLFDAARAAGQIGIPYFILPDGTETLDVQLVLQRAGG